MKTFLSVLGEFLAMILLVIVLVAFIIILSR
jgi:hypothetical protein